MALVDSESAFKKRCEQLQPGLAEKAEAQNLTSFSTFAFSVGSPQNQVSDAEITKLAETLYSTPTLGDVATVRRLHFESCTYLLNDMKTNASNTDSAEPVKKLPFIEKQTRLEAQKRRITGLLRKPDQQPAHSLIDLAFHMVETGALTYLGPSKCHSREMEIQAESKQKSKQIITIEQGSLRSSATSNMNDVDTSTELRLFFALQRRHLAFELVHLLSWQPCQVWLDKLMGSLVHESGPGLNLTQILKADREIFNLMAAEFNGSLMADKGKPPPLDEVFTRLMHDPRVNVHLIAMPRINPPAANPALKGNKREGDPAGPPKGQPFKKQKEDWRTRASKDPRRVERPETQNCGRKTDVLALQFEQRMQQPDQERPVQVRLSHMHALSQAEAWCSSLPFKRKLVTGCPGHLRCVSWR